MNTNINLFVRKTLLFLSSILLIAFIFSTVSASTCLTPPPGIVGWWPGDQSPKDIIGPNNGIFIGGSYVSPGEVGDAFTFSGSGTDYVIIPPNSLLEPQNITVDAWVKANDSPGQFKYIVAKGGNTCAGGSSYALYTGANGGLLFYVYDGNNFVLSPDYGPSVWDNQWHHVAGTYDGLNVKLFVDGNLIGSTATNLIINYSLHDNNLLFGIYLDCNTNQNFAFKGDVDEIEIFNRALSANEIHDIYAAGSAGKCKAINITFKIMPLNQNNCLTINNHGVIPIAIFGAANFNVQNIDVSTLRLNGLSIRAKNPKCAITLINNDNFNDMMCQFKDDSSAWVNSTSTTTLTGNLFDNTPFIGQQTVCISLK